jgi:hypothetical protein
MSSIFGQDWVALSKQKPQLYGWLIGVDIGSLLRDDLSNNGTIITLNRNVDPSSDEKDNKEDGKEEEKAYQDNDVTETSVLLKSAPWEAKCFKGKLGDYASQNDKDSRMAILRTIEDLMNGSSSASQNVYKDAGWSDKTKPSKGMVLELQHNPPPSLQSYFNDFPEYWIYLKTTKDRTVDPKNFD